MNIINIDIPVSWYVFGTSLPNPEDGSTIIRQNVGNCNTEDKKARSEELNLHQHRSENSKTHITSSNRPKKYEIHTKRCVHGGDKHILFANCSPYGNSCLYDPQCRKSVAYSEAQTIPFRSSSYTRIPSLLIQCTTLVNWQQSTR